MGPATDGAWARSIVCRMRLHVVLMSATVLISACAPSEEVHPEETGARTVAVTPGEATGVPEPITDEMAMDFIRDIPDFEESTLDGARDLSDTFCGFMTDMSAEGASKDDITLGFIEIMADDTGDAELEALGRLMSIAMNWRCPEHLQLFD